MPPTTAEEPAMWSRSALARRGWTRSMIAALLGEPDVRRPNPVIASAAPMGLYRRDRVEACESTTDFQARRERARARAEVRGVRTETERAALAQRLRATHIEVPTLPLPKLALAAVAYRNRRERQRCRRRPDRAYLPAAVATARPDELISWEVDYLRHIMTHYEYLLSQLDGVLGRTGARRLVDARLYGAIVAQYPWLSRECGRRMSGSPPAG